MRKPNVPLGELVEPIKKWDPPKDAPDDAFQYVDLSSVDREVKRVTGAQAMTGAEAPSRARQLLNSADVLVSTVRPNLNAVAVVPEQLDGATGSTGFCVLRPDEEQLDTRYLFHWVRSPAFVISMTMRATGASYPAVSDRIVKESKIPLPPLPQQRRIAAILDKADAVRRKRRQTLDLSDQFLRSAFLDMFGDPGTNPKRWPVARLEDVCDKITDGTHHSPPVVPEGIPYITAKHVKPFVVDFFADPWFVSEKDHTEIYARCDPRPGDVLYIKDGVTTGIAAVNHYSFEFSMLSSVALLRPLPEICLPEYLAGWLNNDRVKIRILRGMAGAAIRRLTLTKIKKLEVLVPPISEQNKYVSLVRLHDQMASRFDGEFKLGEMLHGSLVQRAFRREL